MTALPLVPEGETVPPVNTSSLPARKKKKSPSQGGAPPQSGAKSKKLAQDDQVMATNNSSIVSKRSVEKLYYPDETHYFRFFVKKFQRRAPLINRGYHLRLHVIDVLVRDFLKKNDNNPADRKKKKKVVVNLGCGSDVLPWQCLHRYAEHCQPDDVKFVDVDFPDLIERKRQTVLNTPELLSIFTSVQTTDTSSAPSSSPSPSSPPSPLVFNSDQYAQIGCDLRDLSRLTSALSLAVGDSVPLSSCSFIFVAEVSITYMETSGADGVIQWAASSHLGGAAEAEFILLEQILPSGAGHPFASTMLAHFGKLNTQLKSVHAYPTVEDQRARFASRGWGHVDVWTLWQAWADRRFLSGDERRTLEGVEAFDEWEEFALFAGHYCVIHARTGVREGAEAGAVIERDIEAEGLPVESVRVRFDECAGQRGQRRFGAAMQLPKEGEASDVLVNVMGLGTKSRLQSCDVYYSQVGEESPGGSWLNAIGEGGPSTRMCHSLTDLGGRKYLLSGGRDSPVKAYRDCWVFDGSTSIWTKTHDLPRPLYRHSVTRLGNSNQALLVGGKGPKGLFGGCLVYRPEKGWTDCEVVGETKPEPVYGAMVCGFSTTSISPDEKFTGVYAGGLLDDGIIADQILSWELDLSSVEKPTIKFTPLQVSVAGHADSATDQSVFRRLLARFGASCFAYGGPGSFVILGGVVGGHLINDQDEILLCSVTSQQCHIVRRLVGQGSTPRPLLTGHSSILTADGRIVVAGGGATCFSMGTFWNKGVYTFELPNSTTEDQTKESEIPRWVHERTIDITPGEQSLPMTQQVSGILGGSQGSFNVKPIPRVKLQSQDDFSRIVREGKPAVLEGLDLGPCVANWTMEYLVDKVGKDRKVVIHESTNQAMDFNAKNFRYVTTDFADFGQRVDKGDRLYLRALSNELPTEKRAMLANDFPALASDFVLPPELSLVQENIFSSVLRVSGPVNMWLHYDVMANVYCQIGGSKRLVLFPPSDVEKLGFAPGASSSSLDVFASLSAENSARLAQTHPHEAVLSPGEVLFLPPLWLHTATPTSDTSIAVNIFFRDLEEGKYASGRDVYGNRDLAAYEKGRQDVNRIANGFAKLPEETRRFYLLRLADELRRKALG